MPASPTRPIQLRTWPSRWALTRPPWKRRWPATTNTARPARIPEFGKPAELLEELAEGPYYAIVGASYCVLHQRRALTYDANFNVLSRPTARPHQEPLRRGYRLHGVSSLPRRSPVSPSGLLPRAGPSPPATSVVKSPPKTMSPSSRANQ